MRNNVMNRWALVILGASSLLACNAQPSTPNNDPMFQDHWTNTNPNDHGPGTIDPTMNGSGDGKVARRVSVDELRRSIPQIFGSDITWTINQGRLEAIGFNALSRTL